MNLTQEELNFIINEIKELKESINKVIEKWGEKSMDPLLRFDIIRNVFKDLCVMAIFVFYKDPKNEWKDFILPLVEGLKKDIEENNCKISDVIH
jgi:hypothetical protein